VAVKLGIAEMPARMTWKQLYCLSWLAGIGFTMSLFIGQLAFGKGHGDGHGVHGAEAVSHLAEAKLSILVASIIAGVIGTVLLYIVTSPESKEGEPDTAT